MSDDMQMHYVIPISLSFQLLFTHALMVFRFLINIP